MILNSILLVCLFLGSSRAGEDELGFARYLLSEGDYYRSITEYKRTLFLENSSNTEVAAQALLGIGQALFAGGEYIRAGNWMRNNLDQLDQLGHSAESRALMARSYLSGNYGDPVIQVYSELLPQDEESRLYLNLGLACSGRWQEAYSGFVNINNSHTLYERSQNYARLSALALESDWKSPTTAGWLAIIPGAGYYYAGHKQSAISSLVVNVLFFWATAQAFESDQNVLGGFLTAFSLSWYSGNIYGSAQAAKRSNARTQEIHWSHFEY